MTRRTFFVFYFLLLLLVGEISCNHTYFSKEAELVASLLRDYSPQVRPRNGGKTKVDVGMTLNQFSLNEKTEEMTASMYMTYLWYDMRLTWDPNTYYGGINVTRISVDRLWIPNIIIKNSKVRNMKESLRPYALVYYSGKVEWLPPAIFKSSCTMDVTLFPFDWQNCSMIFRSADHDQSEMVFGLRYSPDEISIDDKIYVTSGEWHLCQIPAAVVRKSSDKMFQEVWFTVILRRKPQFYVLNMLLPCVMISVLSCFVFHLPVVAGEKIGLSISLLLGDTIFVFLFAQRMPSAALTVPLVASYLLFSMSLLFLSIVCCVFVYNIHFRSESTHKMHGYWRRLFFDILTPILGLRQPCRSSEGQTKYARVNQELIPMAEAEKSFPSCKPPSERMYYQQATLYGFKARGKNLIEVNGGLSSIPTSIKPASQLYKSTLNTTEELTRHFKKLKAQRKARHDWIYLAFILDSILMWIYLLGFLVGSLCYMFLLWTENYPENIKQL